MCGSGGPLMCLPFLHCLSHSNGFGKQVPISFEVSRVIYDTIITDEEWLWQMLLNLLTNACKYTDRGSIHVKVSLALPQETKSSDKTVPPATEVQTVTHRDQAVGVAEMVPAEVANHLLFEVYDTGLQLFNSSNAW
jgi:signal transduction histidine kinase